MAQDRGGDFRNIAGGGVETSAQHGVGLGGGDQADPGTRAGAPGDHVADEIRGLLFLRPGGAGERSGEVDHMVAHRHALDDFLKLDDVLRAHQRRDGGRGRAGHAANDLALLRFARVIDGDVEQKPVELGFRERIGAFLFDRILGGEHEKRGGQVQRAFADRDVPFLHRFQQGGLGFGRRAVDFIGQQHVGEHRALHEAETAATRFLVHLQHLGAGDVRGHQVGRELNPPETQVQRLRQRGNQHRLGQPRHPDEQGVAAAEHRHQDLFDHRLLADDHLADFLLQLTVNGVKLLDRCFVIVDHGWGRLRFGR